MTLIVSNHTFVMPDLSISEVFFIDQENRIIDYVSSHSLKQLTGILDLSKLEQKLEL